MILHNEQRLEAAIDRELKALPNLPAPRTLLPRVLTAIGQPTPLPWHRRAWQTWPFPLQTVSLLVLLAAFAGVSFGSWQLLHAPAVATLADEMAGWLNALAVIWNTASVLVNAVEVTIQSLSTRVMVACLATLALSYAVCLGLGTIYWRLAYARR